MIINVLRSTQLKTIHLPKVVSGQYIIRDKTRDGHDATLFTVTARNNKWVLNVNREYVTDDSVENEIALSENMLLGFAGKDGGRVQVLTQHEYQGLYRYDYYLFPSGSRAVIGSSEAADICCAGTAGSERAVQIAGKGNTFIISPLCRPNDPNYIRSYIDGILIDNETVAPVGSTVFVMGAKILLGQGFIAVNKTGPEFRVNLKPFIRQPYKAMSEEERVQLLKEPESEFSSAPRMYISSDDRTIEVENPPQLDTGNETPWIVMLGPALTMSAGSLFSSTLTISNILTNGGSPLSALPSLVMSLTMVVGMAVWPTIGRNIQKKNRDEKNALSNADYRAYLKWLVSEIQKAAENQKSIEERNNPSLQECLSMIYSASAQLWQRSRRDPDFLNVMIGKGVLPLKVEFKYQKRGYSSAISDAAREMYAIVEQKYTVNDSPITVPLGEPGVCGVVGKRKDTLSLIRALIIELTALHDAEDLRLAVIYDEKEEDVWRFCKWIPHMNDQDVNFCCMASSSQEVKNLADYLGRRVMKSERGHVKGPHYILILADRKLAEQNPLTEDIYDGEKYDNITALALYNQRRYLPKECRYVIELAGANTAYLRDYQNTQGEVLVCSEYISFKDDPTDAYIRMANIQSGARDNKVLLPERYTFMEMCNVGRAEYIDLVKKWKQSDPVTSLKAQIGIDANGDPVYLDIHEKEHGPHGLIAGMTGSGKSEFIISYIASLAVNYSPEDVAFILIDFKGGGMADVFKDLPHTAGLITNLDGNELKRSFMAIESELSKRQRLFKEISEKKKISNIDIYRYQNLRKADPELKPLPHLILISDEFAELKQQHRDFMEQLVRIARIGRSLGVHLILATQKPDGVVDDQIKSNIRFRVCLKVQDASDSKTMIGRPDASLITNSGRFYLVVGNDEIFEYGQSPWSGAKYEPSDTVKKDIGNEIVFLNKQGMPILRQHVDPAPREKGVPEKQIDAIVSYISSAAAKIGQKASKLWLAPMEGPKVREDAVVARDTSVKPFVLDPQVGIYDDLENQKRVPLTVPFTEGGNALLYGSAGSGVLDFINTMLVHLMENHGPEELQLYIMDYDAGALSAFRRSPHTAGFMSGIEGGNPNMMLGALQQEMQSRKSELQEYGGDYQNYIHTSGKTMPNILLVIHNFQSLMDVNNDIRGLVTTLCREGMKFGMFVFLSGSTGNSIPYAMQPLFYNVYTLQQNNEDQYREIVGKTGGILPAPYRGRGLVRLDGTVYEFQTDMVFQEADNTYAAISDFCNELRDRFGVVEEVKEADHFTWKELKERKIPVLAWQLPVGISKETGDVRIISLYEQVKYLIVYDKEHLMQYRAFLHLLREIGTCTYMGTEPSMMKLTGWDSVKPSNYEDEVRALWKEMLRRAEEGRKAKSEGRDLPDYEHLIYILDGVSEVMEWMKEDARSLVTSLVCGLTSAYHIHFVITESTDNLAKLIGPACLKKAVPFEYGMTMTGEDMAGMLFRFMDDKERKLLASSELLVENGTVEELILLTEEEGEKP